MCNALTIELSVRLKKIHAELVDLLGDACERHFYQQFLMSLTPVPIIVNVVGDMIAKNCYAKISRQTIATEWPTGMQITV